VLTLLVLVMAIAIAIMPGCSRVSHPNGAAPTGSQTSGSKSDATPIPYPNAVAAPRAASVTETPPQVPDLVQQYTLHREAPPGTAWLVITNKYTVNQYVFVDGEQFGWVYPDTRSSFELTPGAHRVTISDSEDGLSNPKSLSEVFDERYSYYYDVVAR